MSDDDAPKRLPLALIGLAQGLVLHAVYVHWGEVEGPFPALPRGLLAFAASAGIVAQMTWTGRRRLRGLLVAGAAGLGIAAATAWLATQRLPPGLGQPWQDEERTFVWTIAAFVALYVGVPFAQIHQRSGTLRFPYDELFRHSWSNAFIGVVAAIFTAAVGIVLWVWAHLFAAVGIEAFRSLFEADAFERVFYPTAFGCGLAIGRESMRVTDSLRSIALALCRLLLPAVALIALAFLLTLAGTGLRPLWATGDASTIVLLLLGGLTVLVNGVVQDGRGPAPYPAWLRLAIRGAVLTMPAYVAIALYSTFLRVQQHGLSPERVWALAIETLFGLYALGYAAAALRRTGPWLAGIQPTNVGMAWILAATLLALHSPLLDPSALSAASQVSRLLRGVVSPADFDFGYLGFELGLPGRRALDGLLDRQDHPEAAAIREGVESVRAAAHAFDWRERRDTLRRGQDVRWLLPLAEAPAPLVEAVTQAVRARESDALLPCVDAAACDAIRFYLTKDELVDFCVVPPGEALRLLCFEQLPRRSLYRFAGELALDAVARPLKRAEALESLRDAPPQTHDPEFLELELLGRRFRIAE